MENKFEKNISMPAIEADKIKLFGESLRRSRVNSGKTVKQAALALETSETRINNWENGYAFPDESELSYLAWAYRIKLEELRKVFSVSKSARKTLKDVRKLPEAKKLDLESEGQIGHSRYHRVSFKKNRIR